MLRHDPYDSHHYRILTTTDIPTPYPNWTIEVDEFTGTLGQDWSITTLNMNGRPSLYFEAQRRDYFYDVDQGFEGLNVEDTGGFPPDTMGAVGLTHFVEILNSEIDPPPPIGPLFNSVAVYPKAGGAPDAMADINAFFEIPERPNLDMFDPRVLFDPDGNRWVACASDRNSKDVILAVSSTSDPSDLSAGWDTYLLPIAKGDFLSDYPTLGIDENGIYLSIYHYDQIAKTHQGHTLVAINKHLLYSETPTFSYTCFPVTAADAGDQAIVPAVSFDSPDSEGHAWFVTKKPPQLEPVHVPGKIAYIRLAWDEGIAVQVDTTPQVLTATDYLDYFDLSGTGITAPTTSDLPINNLSSRILTAVIRDGVLWTCQQVGLEGAEGDYQGGSVDRTGIQWIRMQINAISEQLTILDHGRIFDSNVDPLYFIFPSLMVNSRGDMVVGFSACNASEQVGAYFSWRRADGTTPIGPSLLHSGEADAGGSTFGDYSHTTLDPEDPSKFWTVQAYAFGSEHWATWIAKIGLDFPP